MALTKITAPAKRAIPAIQPATTAPIVAELSLLGSLFVGIDSTACVDPLAKKRSEMRSAVVSGTAETTNGVDSAAVAAGVAVAEAVAVVVAVAVAGAGAGGRAVAVAAGGRWRRAWPWRRAWRRAFLIPAHETERLERLNRLSSH
jgi:O-antigen/teichoic acid export membrane protein